MICSSLWPGCLLLEASKDLVLIVSLVTSGPAILKATGASVADSPSERLRLTDQRYPPGGSGCLMATVTLPPAVVYVAAPGTRS